MRGKIVLAIIAVVAVGLITVCAIVLGLIPVYISKINGFHRMINYCKLKISNFISNQKMRRNLQHQVNLYSDFFKISE